MTSLTIGFMVCDAYMYYFSIVGYSLSPLLYWEYPLSVSLSPLFSGTCLLDFRWLKVRPTLDKFPSLLWPGVTQNWPLDSVRGTLREALPSQTYNFILCCHETIYIHIYALQTIRFKTYQLVILNVYTCNILMTALTLRNIYLYHIHWLHF